uniref:Uncharacterized protein n=1 Tax=Euplotes harpa TaxID=151035 RepID=A0A7S3J7L4_9SPIT|mmetsp:Transcript_24477/g.28151  ORF Transcript_24477/g.28151 Transcript_24477/m.28151 type:complete len:116 (+) Transcript_24477:156-503(+)|eukprot:CAMPEP_0168340860 /NCGR_PEP_ID=MMETSP0213-20121227/14317_1 /TAXON_ID=151035 /ORGANISM="Euplotes harpa, Strain FSP1.4" /LENGTH=115 /DNA_ID=CAMNT_0008347181 /DNA_START=139 /DNA_END=486 /DNA_ORIENTATION=-
MDLQKDDLVKKGYIDRKGKVTKEWTDKYSDTDKPNDFKLYFCVQCNKPFDAADIKYSPPEDRKSSEPEEDSRESSKQAKKNKKKQEKEEEEELEEERKARKKEKKEKERRRRDKS